MADTQTLTPLSASSENPAGLTPTTEAASSIAGESDLLFPAEDFYPAEDMYPSDAKQLIPL